MKLLEDRIRKDGIIREGNVLKVDSFINHQMDIKLSRKWLRNGKDYLLIRRLIKSLQLRQVVSVLPLSLQENLMYLLYLPRSLKVLTLMIITSALKSSHLHIVKYTM